MTTYKLPTYRVRLVRDRATLRCSTPHKAADALRKLLCVDESRESMAVLYLDARNGIVGGEIVATGGTSACVVTAKEVFRGAVVAGASGIILGHNHPSGDCGPSSSDYALTDAIRQAGEVLGIPLLDHVIVTARDGHHSMLDHNEL